MAKPICENFRYDMTTLSMPKPRTLDTIISSHILSTLDSVDTSNPIDYYFVIFSFLLFYALLTVDHYSQLNTIIQV